MTPAINAVKKAKVEYQVHQYEHDSSSDSWGEDAALKTGQNPEQVFKTLVVSLDNQRLAVAIVPVSGKLNLKAMASACKAKKAAMADPKDVQRSTGYVLGGVSPFGQKKRLPTVLDGSASTFATIFVSAGRRGLEIELNPNDLVRLTRGVMGDIVA